jgi:hypothetical protein
MRSRTLVALAVVALSAAPLTAAFGQGLPKVEFGIGGGFASYGIEGSYSGPKIYYDGFPVEEFDASMNDGLGYKKYSAYPASSSPVSINTVFMIRAPIGSNFAIAYSNRVAFCMDSIIHRGDFVVDYDLVLSLYGLTGVEFEYYPKGSAEAGPWFAAVAGLSVLDQPFCQGYLAQLGFGGGATAGWRFSRTLALELNGMYLGTSIIGITQDKVADAGGSVEGSASGFTASATLRFGFGSTNK